MSKTTILALTLCLGASDALAQKNDFTATPVQLTVNPCTLVTKAEAERVIGASVSQGLGANGRICTYVANGNGGVVSVQETTPDFCKNFFGGAQVRADVGQGGMQVKGGGNVQFVVGGGCLEINAKKGGTSVDDATVLAMAKTATGRATAVGPTTLNQRQ